MDEEQLKMYQRCRESIRHGDLQEMREILAGQVGRRFILAGGLNFEGNCSEEARVAEKTLLHFAADKGKEVFVRELLELKADPNVKAKGLKGTIDQDTPLHLAVLRQSEQCVKLLLDFKAKQDNWSRDSRGKTALHVACGLQGSSLKIVDLLLGFNADLTLRDKQGKTAVEYAERKQNLSLADYIKQSVVPSVSDPYEPCNGKVLAYVNDWKQSFGINMENCRFDNQALFSVTFASIAKLRDNEILIRRHGFTSDVTILDGMACVGGDSISFMHHFRRGTVISNEFNPTRFSHLSHNMQLAASQFTPNLVLQRLRLGSVLDFWTRDLEISLFNRCDALYLDPEWGGPEYWKEKSLHIKIGDTPLEDCIIQALEASNRLKWIVLKLPANYNREHIARALESDAGRGLGLDPRVLCAKEYRILHARKCKMHFVVLQREDSRGAETGDLPLRVGFAMSAADWRSPMYSAEEMNVAPSDWRGAGGSRAANLKRPRDD